MFDKLTGLPPAGMFGQSEKISNTILTPPGSVELETGEGDDEHLVASDQEAESEHKIVLANLSLQIKIADTASPSIAASSKETDLSITFHDREGHVAGHLNLRNLNHAQALTLVEDFSDELTGEESKPQFSYQGLKAALKKARNFGASIECDMGATSGEIVRAYRERALEEFGEVRTSPQMRQIEVDKQEDIAELPDPANLKNKFVWIDILAPNIGTIQQLAAKYKFDELALSDCMELNEGVRIENYSGHGTPLGEYRFLTFDTFATWPGEPNLLRDSEMHVFIAKNLCITIHNTDSAAVSELIAKLPQLATRSPNFMSEPSHVVFPMLEAATRPVPKLIDRLSARVEQIREDVREAPLAQEVINEVLPDLEISGNRITKFLDSVANVWDELRSDELVGTGVWSDSHHDRVVARLKGEAKRSAEMERVRTSVENAQFNHMAQNVSSLPSRLAAPAMLVTVGMAVSGFFGQNFTQLPYDSPTLLTASTLITLGSIGGAAWLWFKKK